MGTGLAKLKGLLTPVMSVGGKHWERKLARSIYRFDAREFYETIFEYRHVFKHSGSRLFLQFCGMKTTSIYPDHGWTIIVS